MRKKITIIVVLSFILVCFIYTDYKIRSSQSQLNKSFFCECSIKKIFDINKELPRQEEVINEEMLKHKELMLNFISQINQSLSEEYWLYDMSNNLPFGITPLEFYADSLEDIKTLVIISSAQNTAIVSETGEETIITCFYVKKYRVCNGKILDLISNGETHWNSWEESRESLKEIEQSLEIELVYFGTIDSYEWPKAKKPEYKLEDLESLEVYQNFYTFIDERAGFEFNAEHEVYLGLWNGRSENIRMMYKWIDQYGEVRYSVVRLNMDGTRAGMIDETDENVFEKFKIISVRML